MPLTYSQLIELSQELEHVAGEVRSLAEQQANLAEAILDFQRGSLSMPELIQKAKEIDV